MAANQGRGRGSRDRVDQSEDREEVPGDLSRDIGVIITLSASLIIISHALSVLDMFPRDLLLGTPCSCLTQPGTPDTNLFSH